MGLDVSCRRPVLVVDLDGTLIQTDMLFETFWAALASDWRVPFRAADRLRQGRAALKSMLADATAFDPALLPYNAAVIDYVEAWRAAGGRTALVTASNEAIAQRVGDHLGLFDEVHGSGPEHNLKGTAKAAFLDARFGADGYDYVGDHPSDLAIWQSANKAITVNAQPALRSRVEAICADVQHLGDGPAKARVYLKAMRPHQWAKNVLVFLPMMAAHDFSPASVIQALLAFVAFSLIASSVYVLNDLLDLAADRAHPRKSARPFAAGKLPIAHGTWMILGLAGAGVIVAATVGWLFIAVMAGYFALTTLYSLYLKRKLIVDIFTLAGLYTLRILGGAVATGIAVSVWLFAFSIFFFFSLAAVKRMAELVDQAKRGEIATKGRGYNTGDLPIIGSMATTAGFLSVLVMALYITSPAVDALYSTPNILWGVCLILFFWIARVIMLSHRGRMHDDPVVYAIKDPASLTCFGAIFVLLLTGAVL